MNYKTTLRKLQNHDACEDRYDFFVEQTKITDIDEEIPLKTILEINGIKDAIWALRTIDNIEKKSRLFACDCAEHVAGKFPDKKETLLVIISVARRYANGNATGEELRAAWSAACSAAWSTVLSAAGSAAWSAAGSAADSAAVSAVLSAAESSADSAEYEYQHKLFNKYFCN